MGEFKTKLVQVENNLHAVKEHLKSGSLMDATVALEKVVANAEEARRAPVNEMQRVLTVKATNAGVKL